MKNIRLEINSLELDRPKKRWELYFIIATEDPDYPDKTLISVIPKDFFIQFRKSTENFYSFKPEGENTEGMFILERKMPLDKSVKVRLWLIHSRDKARSTGEVMEKVTNAISGESIPNKLKYLGNNPWIVVAGFGLDIISGVLKDSKDRQLGMVVMDEEFENSRGNKQFDRKNKISTGYGELHWSWVVN